MIEDNKTIIYAPYNGRGFADYEIDFIKENYKEYTNEELAVALNRSIYSIQKKIIQMGLRCQNRGDKCRTGRSWKQEEINYVLKYYKTKSISDMAKELNRTVPSVKGKCKNLGLQLTDENGKQYIHGEWSEEEKQFIKDNYQRLYDEDMAIILNRTKTAVTSQRKKLGCSLYGKQRIYKRVIWNDEYDKMIKDNYKNMTNRELALLLFGKCDDGLAAIVAKRRMTLNCKKENATKESITGGNYLFRHIDNGKYKLQHRVVMENHIGRKLNSNEEVHHIDGNKLNNNINNLYLCINSSQHQQLHAQLEGLGRELVRKGLIYFDHKNGQYCFSDEMINSFPILK